MLLTPEEYLRSYSGITNGPDQVVILTDLRISGKIIDLEFSLRSKGLLEPAHKYQHAGWGKGKDNDLETLEFILIDFLDSTELGAKYAPRFYEFWRPPTDPQMNWFLDGFKITKTLSMIAHGDEHRDKAAELYDLEPFRVIDEMRAVGKSANFMLAYSSVHPPVRLYRPGTPRPPAFIIAPDLGKTAFNLSTQMKAFIEEKVQIMKDILGED